MSYLRTLFVGARISNQPTFHPVTNDQGRQMVARIEDQRYICTLTALEQTDIAITLHTPRFERLLQDKENLKYYFLRKFSYIKEILTFLQKKSVYGAKHSRFVV